MRLIGATVMHLIGATVMHLIGVTIMRPIGAPTAWRPTGMWTASHGVLTN